MNNIVKISGRVFRGLKRAVAGSEEIRRYRKVFLNYFVFEDAESFEAQYAEARAFYEGLLTESGFDPARSPVDIDNAVRYSYDLQFDGMSERLAARDRMRAQERANGPVEPIRGSDEHQRREAEKTFAATGVYGLPTAGYILNKADRERLGLIH